MNWPNAVSRLWVHCGFKSQHTTEKREKAYCAQLTYVNTLAVHNKPSYVELMHYRAHYCAQTFYIREDFKRFVSPLT